MTTYWTLLPSRPVPNARGDTNGRSGHSALWVTGRLPPLWTCSRVEDVGVRRLVVGGRDLGPVLAAGDQRRGLADRPLDRLVVRALGNLDGALVDQLSVAVEELVAAQHQVTSLTEQAIQPLASVVRVPVPDTRDQRTWTV